MQSIESSFVSPICCVHWLGLLLAEGQMWPHHQIQLGWWDINKKLMEHNSVIWKINLNFSLKKLRFSHLSLVAPVYFCGLAVWHVMFWRSRRMVTGSVESALGEGSQVEVSGIKLLSIICLVNNNMICRFHLKAQISF